MYQTRSKMSQAGKQSATGAASQKEKQGAEQLSSTDRTLQQLVQLLTLKIQADESGQNNVKIGAEDFAKIIPEFDGYSRPVTQWFNDFEVNAEAYGLNEKQRYVQARTKMTDSAKLFLESICVHNYAELRGMMEEEFKQESICSADIHEQLRGRKKRREETLREYILQMKKVASRGVIDTQSVIRYIVDGLNVETYVRYSLHECTTYKELQQRLETYERVSKREAKPQQYKKEMVMRTDGYKKQHCFNCGSADHLRKFCKADVKCFRCSNSGHMSRNCPNAASVNVVYNTRRMKRISINNFEVDCLVDTGADVTIMKQRIFKKIKAGHLQRSLTHLRGLGSKVIHPVGGFVGEIEVDEIRTTHRFIVVADKELEHDALLGYDFISKFQLVSTADGYKFYPMPKEETGDVSKLSYIYNITEMDVDVDAPIQYKRSIEKMIKNYKAAENKADSPVELKIVPDTDMVPFRHSPNRMPNSEAVAVKQQIDEWLSAGIVRRSTSNFASRVVVVKKKDGTYRICIDYRKLNTMVLKDCFPVPNIDDVLEKLQRAKYFTVMDLENGFFHVPIEESSKKFTAFVTKEGLFEFNRTPFGFCNSPAVFIRFINHVFQQLMNEDILDLYMDDIIIHGRTADECLIRMEKVFGTAAANGLKIKWKKCHFLQTRIHFLGHIIEDGQIWPGKEKTNAVSKFPLPRNVKGLQSFLGLTGFFRKFIKNYAHIARPLTNLLRKDAVFQMGAAELQAFQELKNALTREPVLKLYDRDAKTELHTDASKEGFGATLLQWENGQLHPVFFWSKKSTEAESQRHSYILEAKAVYLAVKQFRHYLLGCAFKLVTDCVAFKQTLNKKDIPREVVQWVIYLQDFEFQVEYRPGEKLKHVDCLSRYPQQIMLVSSEISARIKKAQANDTMIKAVAEVLSSRPYDAFKMKAGIMYKTINGNDLLVVPKVMEKEIITNAHNFGHFAVQKTLHSVQQNFWIPHLERKVTQIIGNCVKCIIHNRKIGKKEGYLHCINKGEKPLDTLHVDHLGPMDATTKQYKYILAMVDAFTKFVWLYPTKTTSCEETVRKLEDWSAVFGNPRRLITDRGTAFTGHMFAEYGKTNNIDHVWTTTGVPRGNGQIERVNRSVLEIISKLSSSEPEKWFKFVPNVQKAINSHIHESTRKSPFELMFGVRMNNECTSQIRQLLQEEMYESFDEERQHMRQQAKEDIELAQVTYKKHFDAKRKADYGYRVGDLVAIRRTQFTAGRKLASKYLGPYEVITVKRNGRFEVRKAADVEGPISTSSSGDNMKLWRYVNNNEEEWSSEADD